MRLIFLTLALCISLGTVSLAEPEYAGITIQVYKVPG